MLFAKGFRSDLHKANFEDLYLGNNAINKKSSGGILGEILFEHHILIS
jgi:hypothetical protein